MNFINILEKVVPNFNIVAYKYEITQEEDFTYNHRIAENFINGEYVNIDIVEKFSDDYSWDYYIIFKFEDKCYKVEYTEGSQGYKYKILANSLKEVHPKTKEVTYYE